VTTTLLIATTNQGKLREFSSLLAGLPLEFRSLLDDPRDPPVVEEDCETYAGNASKKALAIARWAHLAAIADDSGLEVDALDGAPGVHSARYSGEPPDSDANITRLLTALRDVPEERRTARFRCVIVVARPDGATLTAEGMCEGRILSARRGDGGFGYDPVFLYPPLGQTFAEVPGDAKNLVSHRAQACAVLRPRLMAFLT
jgi:XTP/dITP diphosphohydrolase